MIAELLLVLAQLGAARAGLAEIEVEGPCTGLLIDLPGAGQAELSLETGLLAGERRSFTLAVPFPPEPLPGAVWSQVVGEQLERSGHARLVRLRAPESLDQVPGDLLARPRPVLDAQARTAPWSALFVLGAAFAICLSQRRRPLAVGAIALLACGSLLALTLGRRDSAAAGLRLLEARLDPARDETWLSVRVSRGRLDSAGLITSRVELEPRRAPLRCLSGSEPGSMALVSDAATFYELRAFEPGARRLTRELNAFAGFAEAWLREADGGWSSLGPWALGEALPKPRAGEPPGWLVPALPMGTSIFLGRLADPSSLPDAAGDPAAAAWLRGLGL